MSEEVEGEIFESPPGYGSRQSNSSGHLSAHQHCHASKDVLRACSDCGYNAIKLFGRFTKRIVASSLFVNQAFEYAEAQQILKAFA
jgi:hypothetical protein